MKNPATQQSKSAAVRARLHHPIIDSDGHTAEFEPALFDYLRDVGGSQAVERFKAAPDIPFSSLWYRLSWAERRARRVPRAQWWVHPTKNTLDRATSSLPKLGERLKRFASLLNGHLTRSDPMAPGPTARARAWTG